MDKFKFSGLASVLHLNARKEGPNDEKELALDVKMEAVTGAEVADFFEPTLSGFMFLEGGAVRNPLMGAVTFGNELEHYRLEAMGGVFQGVKVKKFSLEPKDGNQVRLTFSLSFKPSGTEVAKLAEYLQDAIEIDLQPANDELDLEGGNAA